MNLKTPIATPAWILSFAVRGFVTARCEIRLLVAGWEQVRQAILPRQRLGQTAVREWAARADAFSALIDA
jgi:hypothetical protein